MFSIKAAKSYPGSVKCLPTRVLFFICIYLYRNRNVKTTEELHLGTRFFGKQPGGETARSITVVSSH